MSGLLDELLKDEEQPEQKPEAKGMFEYSDKFKEYAEKNNAAVGGEKEGE